MMKVSEFFIRVFLIHSFPIAKSLYIILEYCKFGRLKDYLKSCGNALETLGLPVKLGNYSDYIQESYDSLKYMNILQSNNCNSYSNVLPKKNSCLNVASDSGYGDSIVYIPESVDSGYTSGSVAESLLNLSRDYVNSPGILYYQDVTNFALQIAFGLQHLENLKVLLCISQILLMTTSSAIDLSWRYISP